MPPPRLKTQNFPSNDVSLGFFQMLFGVKTLKYSINLCVFVKTYLVVDSSYICLSVSALVLED